MKDFIGSSLSGLLGSSQTAQEYWVQAEQSRTKNSLLTHQQLTQAMQRAAEDALMANTPEGKVKAKVTKQLKEVGAYYFFPQTGGFGKSGVPDIVGCYKGCFFGIECKAGKNKPTPLQEKQLRDIGEAGGFQIVVNEANVDSFMMLLIAHANQEWD